jgi:hypothetical protein
MHNKNYMQVLDNLHKFLNTDSYIICFDLILFVKTKKNYIISVIKISGFEKKIAKINNCISQHSRWTTV